MNYPAIKNMQQEPQKHYTVKEANHMIWYCLYVTSREENLEIQIRDS